MRLVLRGVGFVIGAWAATLVIGLLTDIFPWFWLPVAMGALIWVISRTQPWLKTTPIASLFAGAVATGTTFTYCLSTKPIGARFGSLAFSGPALFVLGLIFGVVMVLFLGRGFANRSSAPLTKWLVVPVVAGCMVGYLSGGIGGANHMHGFMTSMFHITQEQAEVVVRWLRKTIHFTAYGLVGYSLFRAAIAGKTPRINAVIFALLTVLCLASFDEIRQTTAPNRSGSPWDVMLDLSGAASFALIGALTIASAPRKRSVA